jgi:hypothetical protein
VLPGPPSSPLLAEPCCRGGCPVSAPEACSLDLHEGISDPGGCVRWPRGFRLRNELTGELVLGRCKATNKCPYCQQLYVIETLEMLKLDAAEHAPTLWAVLTSAEHLTRPDTYEHLSQLRKAARRRWPHIQWFVQVEFQRRGALHLNLLIKGVPVEDDRALYELLTGIWCQRVDAVAGRFDAMKEGGQWLGRIADSGGVMAYLQKTLSHGLKREQAPPLGWRGHRTSQTRGYFVASAAVMRRRARESLQRRRATWRADKLHDNAHDVELAVRQELEQAARSVWVLSTDRGARLSSVAFDPQRLALRVHKWREPDLLDAFRYLLADLPDQLDVVSHERDARASSLWESP